MLVYRIAKTKYLTDLSGEGAKINGGRWNKKGSPVLYTASQLSLAVLELLAYNPFEYINTEFRYISLKLPTALSEEEVTIPELGIDWRSNPPSPTTTTIGYNWHMRCASLALKVPSAVLPYESNFILNPAHPQFNKIKIVEEGPLLLDQRLNHDA